MKGMKRKGAWLLVLCLIGMMFTTSALAAETRLNWGSAVETSYDMDIPGTILVYKNELSQGGMNLSTKAMVDFKQASQVDIVFDTGAGLGANGIIDLGKTDFESVNAIPASGYSTFISKTAPGNLYLIATHDGNFAKLLIKSIIGKKR